MELDYKAIAILSTYQVLLQLVKQNEMIKGLADEVIEENKVIKQLLIELLKENQKLKTENKIFKKLIN